MRRSCPKWMRSLIRPQLQSARRLASGLCVKLRPVLSIHRASIRLTGAVQANYDKHHLLLGVEPEQPGNPNERVLLDLQTGRAGLQVCKDMDFPQLSREYARDGINVLLVPAWDFDLDRWLHARMAVLPGVENGFALARAGRNGLLTLSDSRGRILAEKAIVPGEFVSLSGRLSVADEQTFYTRTGDWFAWICVLILLALLISRVTPASRSIKSRAAAT